MKTILRTVLILALLLALVPLPSAIASQPTPLPGLLEKVELIRDVDGIPHIIAKNEHDLFLMQGWVHAEDRLFQMDLTRRRASGTLAELLGPAALGEDVQMRTLGMRRAAERSLPLQSAETLAALTAYAEGVNTWVAHHQLPPEYGLLELTTFEPWTPLDSLAGVKLIAFGLSFDLGDLSRTEALLSYMAAGNILGFDGSALFSEDLFRSAPFDPASTVPDASMTTAATPLAKAEGGILLDPHAAAKAIHPVTLRLAREYRQRVEDLPAFRQAVDPDDQPQGSNEWAVSGALTADGKPLLANDPHLALDTPSTFYQNHLKIKGTDWDVIGSSFPGAPYVILGQNRDVAWGATVNPMDVTDTFQEQVVPDPASPSGLSTVYLGQLEPIVPLPVAFQVNQLDGVPDNLVPVPPGGSIPPAVLIVPRRNHGPIIGLDTALGVGLSIQYTGFSGTREVEAFRAFNLAAGLDDFVAGLQYFDFGSQNFAVVDGAGNIGYFTSAEMPLREDLQQGFVAGLPPWFLRNGTGGNEWLAVGNPQPGQAIPYEILPVEEMPHTVNPPAGYFVNANNDPAGTSLDNNPLNQLRPSGGIYYLNPGYAIGTRAGRIKQALGERLAQGPITRADMQAIQADVVMLDAQVLTPYILTAFDNATSDGAHPALAALAADPRVAEAVSRLATWDHATPTGLDEGYDATDGRGILLPPTQEEIDASIAATIYSVWRGQVIANTLDAVVDALGLPGPGSGEAMKALRHLLDNYDTNQGIGASGLDFFVVPGVDDPNAQRDILILKSLADTLDLLAGLAFVDAFASSTNQADYRWGRLHRIVFNHPLGGPFDIPPAGGAFPPPLADLSGIPVDGGFGVVDASSHSARADSSHDFMFSGGPVRRYVGGPAEGNKITGQSSLPGGESGVLGSPLYANLLAEWLANEAHPHRRTMDAIRQATATRQVFQPGAATDHRVVELQLEQ